MSISRTIQFLEILVEGCRIQLKAGNPTTLFALLELHIFNVIQNFGFCKADPHSSPFTDEQMKQRKLSLFLVGTQVQDTQGFKSLSFTVSNSVL